MLLRLTLLFGILLAPVSVMAEPAADKLHDDNIQAFAIVAAMAQAASDRCADIKINIPMIQAIQSGIGYDPDRDRVALASAVQSNLASIAGAVAKLPSPQAWCDEVYRQFGPEGTVTPRLMLR